MRVFVYLAIGLLTAAVGLRPLALAGEPMPYAGFAALALAAFALALYTKDWVLSGPGAALLIGEYLLALDRSNAGFDPAAPVLAVALVVLLELIDLSLLLSGATPHRKVLVRHGRYLVVVVAAGGVLAATAWAGGRVLGGSSVLLLLGAAVGAIGALGVALVVVRRSLAGLGGKV